MSTFSAATAVYEGKYSPRVTISRDTTGALSCVIDVDDLEPQRTVNSDERLKGILSLDPPSVRVKARRSRTQTHRDLISAACRAVTASATSTTGSTGGIGAILMTHMHVAWAVRAALRKIGEEI